MSDIGKKSESKTPYGDSCGRCRKFEGQYLQSENERLELKMEVHRLTDKIDMIRRLQEVGVVKP